MQEYFEQQWASLVAWCQEHWIEALIVAILILICLGLAKLISLYGGRILRRLVQRLGKHSHSPIDSRKANTLATLLTSVFRFLVWGAAFVVILSLLGLNQVATTILATAGIGTIAIGFGAQNLIRDFLSGVFLVSDNLLAVGDLVTAGGVTGTVETVKLRSTGIRSNSGELHIIPNGSIGTVVNYTSGNALAIVDLSIPATHPYAVIEPVLLDTLSHFQEQNTLTLEPPQLLGVIGDPSATHYIVRSICRARPMRRADAEQALHDYLCTSLHTIGIEVTQGVGKMLGEETHLQR